MIKKTKKKITYPLPLLIKTWIQHSIDEALTIAVWVLAWGLLEPYMRHIPDVIKWLTIVLLILILQHDLLKMRESKKKKKGKKK